MAVLKNRIWELGGYGAVGDTDLKDCEGKLIETYGCSFLLCTEGKATATISFNQRHIVPGDLIFIPYDISFIPVNVSENFKAKYISVQEDISDDAFYRITTVFWDRMYESPVLHTSGEMRTRLVEWLDLTGWMLSRYKGEDGKEMLKNNFSNIFIGIYNEMSLSGGLSGDFRGDRSKILVSRFYKLLSRHYVSHKDVAYYARGLNISADYLYKLVSGASGASPKEMINWQIIVGIKTLLQSTDLSVKSIAAELNFEDPAYLCRFFRRETGMSPQEFRTGKTNKTE